MSDDTKNKWVEAYKQMLENAKEWIVEARHETGPVVDESLEKAREKLEDVGEFTKEETEKLSEFLRNDLHSAAEYIAAGERELGDWLRLDLLYLEDKTMEAFSQMVDQTKLELDRIKYRADHLGTWRSGEITAPGVLVCDSCGEKLHFENTGHVPPCPKCHGTEFKRETND